MPQPAQPAWSASLLRRDLSARAHHLARLQNLLHDIHPGSESVVIFGRDEQGRHGNFHPASDITICANPAWLRRLTKPHTASRRSRARNDWPWMELDSANSSDALLMNIFCHPAVFNAHTLAPAVANLLNVDPTAQPCFGINPGVPLKHPRKGRSKLPPELTDRTEIDLQLGNLFLEAKLTESNFQTAAPRLIERYRDLETVFDLTRLPRNPTTRRLEREPPVRPTSTNPGLPTHPQRPRRLRRRSILLRPLRRPPSRSHRNLVLHPDSSPPPHLRHTPETPHLAGAIHYPPPGPPAIPRSKIRNRA